MSYERSRSMNTTIFCDFDGTIAQDDVFVKAFQQFTPELTAKLLPEIYAFRLTLKDGVSQLIASIPASQYPAMLEYVKSQPMRLGFVELLDFLDSRQVPLVVISGGLVDIVKAVLGEELTRRVAGIHAIEIDAQGEYLQLNSDWEGETELIAKVKVIEHYQVDQPIAIGDSITDYNMAMYVPIVFARDKLATYLDEQHKAYIPWTDFYDIQGKLAQIWGD